MSLIELRKISKRFGHHVVLSDIKELRYAEIAGLLGIPEGTVKSRLFRGRRLLQRRLRGYAEAMGYIKLAS